MAAVFLSVCRTKKVETRLPDGNAEERNQLEAASSSGVVYGHAPGLGESAWEGGLRSRPTVGGTKPNSGVGPCGIVAERVHVSGYSSEVCHLSAIDWGGGRE